MLDIRIFKDFLALARIGNFSRAAEHCNITTSGLSRRIAVLEAWLGTPVLDRIHHPLQLTDAGREFRVVAEQLVSSLEATRASIQRRYSDVPQAIRIVAPHIMSRVFFPNWLHRLRQQFGETSLSITSANLPECHAALQSGQADFLVTFSDPLDSIGARYSALRLDAEHPRINLGTERLIAISAPGLGGGPLHYLGMPREPVSYLPYSEECSLGWIVENTFRQRQDLPKLVRRHGSSLADGLTAMALVGLGLAWLPQGCVRHDLDLGRLVRADDGEYDIPLNIHLLRRGSGLNEQAEALWHSLISTPLPPTRLPGAQPPSAETSLPISSPLVR